MAMQQTVTGITERADLIFFASVFASVALLVLVSLHFASGVAEIRRRAKSAAGTRDESGAPQSTVGRQPGKSHASLLAKLVPADEARRSQLRKFLALAGFTSSSALAVYQLVRFASALLLGLLTAVNYDVLFPNAPLAAVAAMCIAMAALGFYFPKTIVSLRRDALCEQHRRGFPDFLDLMVICADAGVSVDSAIDRVSGDLALGYPSLAANLRLMCLELRAGYSLRDALNNLAERLGIDEAKSFATLVQQSEELGSGLVSTLRVYSDEMRAKRLVRAEEKGHALPAKLVIPLGLCVFPVILGITLLPVILRLYKAFGQ